MKKGITLTAIIAVIIVLSILASTASVTAVNIINNINKTKLAMEFLMVEEAYESADLTDTKNSIYGEYIKLDISVMDYYEKSKYFEFEDYSAPLPLRILNLNALELEGLSRGYGKKGTTDYFAVSEKTNKIYYIAGEHIGDEVYYAYCHDLAETIDNNKFDISTNEYGVIFEYDKNLKTEPQEIIVKIPYDYIRASVTATDGVTVERLNHLSDYVPDEVQETYQLFSVNKDKAVREQYEIEVEFLDSIDGFSYRWRRVYEKIDKVLEPVDLDISSKVQQFFRYDTTSNELDAYMSGFKVENNIGKIVEMKYDNFDVSTLTTDYKKYFKSNGINLKNDKLPINKGVETVFVYCEDEYGNIGTKKIEVDPEIIDGFVAASGAKYANPPVPEGFEIVSTTSYTTWNGKFTIEDDYGNQFVWVPVGNNITANGKIYDIVDRYGRRVSKYNNNVLQNTNFNSFVSNEVEKQYTSLGNITYDQIYQSVKKFEGFYISRYELAIDSSKNRLVSRSLLDPLEETLAYYKNRLVEFGEAYPKTSEKIDPVFATAILPNAEHYDTLFQFLVESGKYSSSVVHSNSSSVGIYTALGNRVVENTYIEDLAGSLGEWTLEKYGSKYVYRSGKAEPTKQAMSSRTASDGKAGARIALYLTENP